MEFTNAKYAPAFQKAEHVEKDSLVLLINNHKLLMKKEKDTYQVPKVSEMEHISFDKKNLDYMGTYDGADCYCLQGVEPVVQKNFAMVNLYEVSKYSDDPGVFMLAGTANHILHWKQMNQYCGRCGHKTIDSKEERAKVCPECGNLIFPRISPATITAIFRDDQILLARNGNFRGNMYSLIAGFVEPGENLEQCVEREIFEEVGIKVKNVRYFGSQTWPFPDSIMLAFIADYESGEIEIDQKEIVDANWYSGDNLPEIPSTDSIAGKMIRWYRDQKS